MGNAPRIFALASKGGLPYVSLIFCALFGLLGFMGINSGSGKVFGWFSNSRFPQLYALRSYLMFRSLSDRYCWNDNMVRYRRYIHTVLPRLEGARIRPEEASLLDETAAIRGILRDSYDVHHLFGTPDFVRNLIHCLPTVRSVQWMGGIPEG